MPIIHLARRTTGSEVDFSDNKSSQASLLYLKNIGQVDRFSMDLTVGDAWAKNYSSAEKQFVRIDSEGIHLGRHDSIVVEVAEDMRVPNNMYGLLIPTGSIFLARGILIASAKIEPGFSGKLKLRLFNTTSEKHVLKQGAKLGSALFFATETTVPHPTITRDMQISDRKVSRRSRLWQWLKTNPQIWISWLVSLGGGSLTALLVSAYMLSGIRQGSAVSAPAQNTVQGGTLSPTQTSATGQVPTPAPAASTIKP